MHGEKWKNMSTRNMEYNFLLWTIAFGQDFLWNHNMPFSFFTSIYFSILACDLCVISSRYRCVVSACLKQKQVHLTFANLFRKCWIVVHFDCRDARGAFIKYPSFFVREFNGLSFVSLHCKCFKTTSNLPSFATCFKSRRQIFEKRKSPEEWWST